MGGQKNDAANTSDQLKLPAGDSTQAALAHQLGDKEALHIIKGLNQNGASDQATMQKLGLGLHDDPFSKEWEDPGEKGVDKTIHGIKEALGYHHTIEDKAREREVSRLTPDQKKQYDQEEAATRAYELGANINAKRPDTPMHDQVEQKVSNFETEQKNKALASLTPAERQQYDKEQKDQADRFDKWLKNPMAPMSEEGPHPISDKVDKLTQLNAEKDLTENPTGYRPGQGPDDEFDGPGPRRHRDIATPNADGSTTHTGDRAQDNYTEKTENGKNVKTYTNGVVESTDQKSGAVDVQLPNGDSIHITKDGDSSYASSNFFRGDSRTPVHYKSQHDALEHARQTYEFPYTGPQASNIPLEPRIHIAGGPLVDPELKRNPIRDEPFAPKHVAGGPLVDPKLLAQELEDQPVDQRV